MATPFSVLSFVFLLCVAIREEPSLFRALTSLDLSRMRRIHRLATPLGMLDSGLHFGFSLAWFLLLVLALPALLFTLLLLTLFMHYTCLLSGKCFVLH